MAARRLLVVDDERAIAEFIAAVAATAGYAVHIVDRSSDFEFHFDQCQPTVVIMDIVMPDRDGLELLGVLERRKFSGHLVLMSGSDARYINMAGASAKARGLHLAAILTKPCPKKRIQDLLEVLAGNAS